MRGGEQRVGEDTASENGREEEAFLQNCGRRFSKA